MSPSFGKVLEQIGRRHDIIHVFDDFLKMSICAFSMGRMEEEYMSIVKRYDKDEVPEFGKALGMLFNDYQRVSDPSGSWDDLLGEYFMEINSKSSASSRGQFFTPVHICDLMAQIVYSGDPGETINDPSSGSSRNLIAHARLQPNHRYQCFYHAYDLDIRCVHMSVLNYIMYGMKGVVIHMDTLKMKVFGGYRIYLPETGLGVQPITADQCNAYLFTNTPIEKKENTGIINEEIITDKKGQIKLF